MRYHTQARRAWFEILHWKYVHLLYPQPATHYARSEIQPHSRPHPSPYTSTPNVTNLYYYLDDILLQHEPSETLHDD